MVDALREARDVPVAGAPDEAVAVAGSAGDELIAAVAAVEDVGVGAREEGVLAASTAQAVGAARPADQDLVASRAADHVVPGPPLSTITAVSPMSPATVIRSGPSPPQTVT